MLPPLTLSKIHPLRFLSIYASKIARNPIYVAMLRHHVVSNISTLARKTRIAIVIDCSMMEDKSWRMLLCAVEVVGFWCFQSLLLPNIRRLIIVFLCLKVNKGLAYSTLLSIIQDVVDQTIYRQTKKTIEEFRK